MLFRANYMFSGIITAIHATYQCVCCTAMTVVVAGYGPSAFIATISLHFSVCLLLSVMFICRLWAFSFQRNTQIKPLEALQWMKGMREYYMCKYGNYSDEEYLMK